MGDKPVEGIVLGLIDRLFPMLMKNPALSVAVVGVVSFLGGAGALYAFTWMFGFERLRSILGAVFVLSFFVGLFATVIAPWAFPSLRGWYSRPIGKKIVFIVLLVFLLADVVFWGAVALGYL